MSDVTDEYLKEIEERVQECFQDPEKGVAGIEVIVAELKKEGLVIEASRVESQLTKWQDMGDAYADEQLEQ